MDAKISKAITRVFFDEELTKIARFLCKGFSPDGLDLICNIFLSAHRRGVPVNNVLHILQVEWSDNWFRQDLSIRANPDAPYPDGSRNRESIQNVYNFLKIPPPIQKFQLTLQKK